MWLKRICFILFGGILFIVGICIGFCFLKESKSNDIENNHLSNVIAELTIDDTGTEETIISNPCEITNNVKMVLPRFEIENNAPNECLIDLSFLGFDQKVKLTAYEVGYITPSDMSYIQVTHDFSIDSQETITMAESKVENIQGNCLILAISNQINSIESDSYVVVLDYSNHISYIVKTNLLYSWVHRPSLQLIDITGDGQQDIIISNVINGYKSGTSCEIFKYDKNNDTLKSIYMNQKVNNDIQVEDKLNYFSGRLIDDYQAVIECQQIGFEKKISILDAGYKKKDLEIDKAPKDTMNDMMRYCRCYKKGKVLLKENNTNLTISPLDNDEGIQVYSNPNLEKGIRLKYYIYMGRWNAIGAAYAYMGYDKTSDSLKIVGAAIEINSEEN
jgi:hypothetical protein